MQQKKLKRSRSESMIAGVCGGLGDYFGLDPTVVRLVFVLLALLGGPGLVLYVILWIVMPRQLADTPLPVINTTTQG